MAKIFLAGDSEATILGSPRKSLDKNLRMANAHNVERIRFTASAGRRRGSRLHYQRRMATNLVTLGGVARMADVQMAGEKKVGAALSQSGHRQPRPANQIALMVTFRQIKRMMRDDHF